jgi:hypothetical protein
MARMRRAHFKIDGPGIRLDGAHRGRLTIEDAAGRQIVRVRPLRRREYVLPLASPIHRLANLLLELVELMGIEPMTS